MDSNNIFEIHSMRCSYDRPFREGRSKVVLEIDHLTIPQGKIVFIVGESGIGKSTILETLGMMNITIVPDESTKMFFRDGDGHVTDMLGLWHVGGSTLANFRMRHFSFIFQNTNLMKNFTAFENVGFTRMLQGFSSYQCRQRTRVLLSDLGLEHVDEKRMATDLSGGQQQRLAFARAILPEFTVLFGDEPTGNLDSTNAVRVMEVLKAKLKAQQGATAVIVSHDEVLAERFADLVVRIERRTRPSINNDGELIAYGHIDENCVEYRKATSKV